VETITPDLVGKIPFVPIDKTDFPEKICLIGQDKDPADFQAPGLVKAGFHQKGTNPLALKLPSNGKGTNFGQIIPADMEGTDPSDLTVIIDDKIAKMIIERAYRAGQEQSLIGKALQQGMNGPHITHSGGSYSALFLHLLYPHSGSKSP